MEKIGKKKPVHLNQELVADLAAQEVSLEGNDTFTLPFVSSDLLQLEFYSAGAPHFRKNKALSVHREESLPAEILLFEGSADSAVLERALAVLNQYPVCRAILKNQKIVIKLAPERSLADPQFAEMAINLQKDLTAI